MDDVFFAEGDGSENTPTAAWPSFLTESEVRGIRRNHEGYTFPLYVEMYRRSEILSRLAVFNVL